MSIFTSSLVEIVVKSLENKTKMDRFHLGSCDLERDSNRTTNVCSNFIPINESFAFNDRIQLRYASNNKRNKSNSREYLQFDSDKILENANRETIARQQQKNPQTLKYLVDKTNSNAMCVRNCFHLRSG